MADFSKAFNITASWEGKWSKIPEKCDKSALDPGEECEENAYGVWWGTNYGLTGTFMRDFAGWKAEKRAVFQNMGIQQAGEVWRNTRWKWGKFDQINDQEIANLLFDWGVRRWSSLTITEKTTTVKGKKVTVKRSGLGEVFGLTYPYAPLFEHALNINEGGNPKKRTNGFYKLSDAAINMINSHRDPAILFALLKAKRMALDNPTVESIKARYNSFSYTGTPNKDGYMATVKKKRSLVESPKSQSTEGGNGLAILVAIGIGGKALKIW